MFGGGGSVGGWCVWAGSVGGAELYGDGRRSDVDDFHVEHVDFDFYVDFDVDHFDVDFYVDDVIVDDDFDGAGVVGSVDHVRCVV